MVNSNKYDEAYLRSKDIDWFCIIGRYNCHIASAGGLIPDVINDREKLRNIQKMVFELDYLFEVEDIEVNEQFLDYRFDNDYEAKESYLSSFINMARKGFVSFDRTNFTQIEDSRDMNELMPAPQLSTENLYHIVCWPKEFPTLNLDQALYKTRNTLDLNQKSDIKLLELFQGTNNKK